MADVPCTLLPDGKLQFTVMLGDLTGTATLAGVRVDDSYTSDDDVLYSEWFEVTPVEIERRVYCTILLPSEFVATATTVLVRAVRIEQNGAGKSDKYNPFTIAIPAEVSRAS